jgi:MFS family permease
VGVLVGEVGIASLISRFLVNGPAQALGETGNNLGLALGPTVAGIFVPLISYQAVFFFLGLVYFFNTGLGYFQFYVNSVNCVFRYPNRNIFPGIGIFFLFALTDISNELDRGRLLHMPRIQRDDACVWRSTCATTVRSSASRRSVHDTMLAGKE